MGKAGGGRLQRVLPGVMISALCAASVTRWSAGWSDALGYPQRVEGCSSTSLQPSAARLRITVVRCNVSGFHLTLLLKLRADGS